MFTSRPCAGTEDLALMREFLIALRQSYGHCYWHTGDLTWRTFLITISNSLSDSVRLWFDRDHLVGFAVFEPPRRKDAGFDLQVHPRAGAGLADEMLDWVQARWHAVRENWRDARLVVDPGVYESDTLVLDALARNGLDNLHNDGILLHHPLTAPMGPARLPVGWTVRPIAGEAEASKRAAVHRDAFHPSRVTDEQYERLMHWPGYTPELDLVAVSPQGEFGSFCLGWLDPVNRVGEFEPVGTHSAFRRRGLASAVVREGLRRMRDAGAMSAVIGPIDDSDTRALAVYQSLGFKPTIKMYAFAKS